MDSEKFSCSKSLATVNFSSKNFNSFVKDGFESSNFNQLPVIEEEEGYISEDELELSQDFLRRSLFNKNCPKKSAFYTSEPNGSLENLKNIRSNSSNTKFPALVNINCLMNTEVKQTQAIWNTKFGKRLICGKNFDKNLNFLEIKQVQSQVTRKNNKKFENYQPSKLFLKKNFIKEQNVKNSGGDKLGFNKMGRDKRTIKTSKDSQTLLKMKSSQEKVCLKKSLSLQSTEFAELPEIPSEELLVKSQTTSSFSRNQRFLTECVKNILDNNLSQIDCQICNESFSNEKELNIHLKKHEIEKEICILCEKIFYTSNEFIQHLLSHEGVDRFSCKKCKTYFPNLKKYRQHCQNFHFSSSDINYSSQSNLEQIGKWLPKFYCGKCKLEFECEEVKNAHRKNHIKQDLTAAYLLNPKNVTLHKRIII